MGPLRVRNSRRAMAVALGVGALGLLGAAAFEGLRGPFALFVFFVCFAVGLVGCLDRRIKLEISEAGLRYAGWGPDRFPWHEFAAFRWRTWRGTLYLQLVPRRPSELVRGFSFLGKLNHHGARLVRMPTFAVRVTPLAIDAAEIRAHVATYLPENDVTGP